MVFSCEPRLSASAYMGICWAIKRVPTRTVLVIIVFPANAEMIGKAMSRAARNSSKKTSATCHMPRRQGERVGPDLSGINNKTKEELLTSILNRTFATEPRFVNSGCERSI